MNYPHNTRRLEVNIVRLLLEQMRDARVDYPADLLDRRRAEYLQQITTIKSTRQAATRRVDS